MPIKINTPNINTISSKKRDFYERFENQKPNTDKFRKGWVRIFNRNKLKKEIDKNDNN
jgi:hypothetical protein